jgi:6-phosphogluconolactonase (cycloisomerase 2 family)
MLVGCCSTSTPVLRFITISPTSQSTTVGTAATFTATAYYSDGSTAPATGLVTWASSNTAVATVSGGICNPLRAGTTTISASAAGTPGATATLTVTNPATPVSLAITPTPSPVTVPLGGTQQFTATVTYSDNSTQDVTTSSAWSSATTSAATIGATTGLASVPTTATVGATSIITATYSSLTASATLTVGAAVPVSLQIIATPNVTSLAIGNSVTLLAQEVYSDSTLHIPANVVGWTNTSAATASLLTLTASPESDTSIAHALSAGSTGTATTTITATDGSLTHNVTLTVVTGSSKFAYVNNAGSGNIGSYTVTAGSSPYLTALGTFPVGSPSFQIAIHPSGQYLYYVDTVTDVSAASVAADGTLTAIGSQPLNSVASFPFAAIDPYGRFLYVSDDANSTIYGYVLNPDGSIPATSTTITTNLSTPDCMVIDPTGKYLYAINSGADNVSAYSIQADGSLSPLSTPTFSTGNSSAPEYATLDPTGTYLFVAGPGNNTIATFSIGSNGILTPIGTAPFAVPGATTTANFIFNLVVDPSGTHLYAADSGGFVWAFNLSSGGVISSTPVAGSPFALAGTTPSPTGGIVIDPTGKFLATEDIMNSVIDVFTFGTGGALNTPSTVPTGNSPLFVTLYNAP